MKKELIYNNTKGVYTTEGSGETLILVHGFCGDKSIWDLLKKQLADYYHIITPDLPGYGESGLPVDSSVITIEYYAQYLHAIIETEKISDFILTGHSMGGYVALAYAELFPRSMKKLCLFHSHPFEDTPQKKESRRRAMEFIEKYGTKRFTDELYNSLFAPDFLTKYPDIVNTVKEKAAHYPPEALLASTRAMIVRKDRSAVMKNLTIPVLLIIGKQDAAIDYEISKAMCPLAPISEVHILPEVGHLGMIEAPTETAQILRNFIERKF